jgi:hypothetical protein
VWVSNESRRKGDRTLIFAFPKLRVVGTISFTGKLKMSMECLRKHVHAKLENLNGFIMLYEAFISVFCTEGNSAEDRSVDSNFRPYLLFQSQSELCENQSPLRSISGHATQFCRLRRILFSSSPSASSPLAATSSLL